MKLFSGFKGARWIQIRFNSKGAYFIKNNKRYYLSEFMKYGVYGLLSLNNFGGLVIRISEDGEYVKAVYSFN